MEVGVSALVGLGFRVEFNLGFSALWLSDEPLDPDVTRIDVAAGRKSRGEMTGSGCLFKITDHMIHKSSGSSYTVAAMNLPPLASLVGT